MHMDGTDMAILGGGGTAALGFVLGVVQRYVGPRLEAMRDRLQRLETAVAAAADKLDAAERAQALGDLEGQKFTSLKIAEVHTKIEALFETQGRDIGEMKTTLARLEERIKR